RADGVALLLKKMHLRNLLVERAPSEDYAERVFLERAVTLFESLRARVLVALVAVEAVVDLFQNLARRVALVRQFEAVAAAQVLVESAHKLRQVGFGAFDLNEVLVIERVREAETDPTLHALARVRAQRV